MLLLNVVCGDPLQEVTAADQHAKGSAYQGVQMQKRILAKAGKAVEHIAKSMPQPLKNGGVISAVCMTDRMEYAVGKGVDQMKGGKEKDDRCLGRG